MMSNPIDKIKRELNHCLVETSFHLGEKYRGKVRDTYILNPDTLALITTDRQSAFDRVLAAVPFKGQVLNLVSAWWFKKTQHIIANHMISVPDPNVLIAKKCRVFPVEFVVRGYITGTTSTSLWTHYQQGVRHYCGHDLADGLVKNQQLSQPILTPTTKDVNHDRPISAADIINEGLMTEAEWQYASTAAMRLYHYGAEVAKDHGLILVDTKYEMGVDGEGNIRLVDEIHTPDSSRYWILDSYLSRFQQQQEPENVDKEFLRLWFVEHCDPYHDKELPKAPEELVITLASRYIQLYEMITGNHFPFTESKEPVLDRILRHMEAYQGALV